MPSLMAHLADSWPDSQICIKMYNAAFTLPIMAPVRDQTALLHEKRKSRITILSDLQCHFLKAVVYGVINACTCHLKQLVKFYIQIYT